jgi:hypothetical protein
MRRLGTSTGPANSVKDRVLLAITFVMMTNAIKSVQLNGC